MTEIDPSFVIHLFAGNVVSSDRIEQRSTGSPDCAGNIIAGLQFGDLTANFKNLSEAFVTDDEVFAAGRSVSVKCFVDFAVGRIDADLQCFYQYCSSFWDLAHMRLWLIEKFRSGNLSKMNAIRFSRQYGDGFHGEFDSSKFFGK